MSIRHRGEPAAVEISPGAAPFDRAAVAHVILSCHGNALAVQKVSKVAVPVDQLRNAVDDLYHRPWLPLGQPFAAVEFSLTQGIHPKNHRPFPYSTTS